MGIKAEKAEATRARLIEVAGELFGERGYDAVPIEEVLERAGVSKGALYHHFPNKEALFEAVYRYGEQQCMIEIAEVAMKEEGNPLEMLRAGCQRWLDMVMDSHVRRIAVVDGPRVLGWQKWRAIDQEYAGGLTRAALKKAMDAGQIHRQNLDMLSHLALAMLGEAAMVIAEADDPVRAREEAGEVVDRLIDAVARG